MARLLRSLLAGVLIISSCWSPVQAQLGTLPTNMDLVTEALRSTVDDALSDMNLPATQTASGIFLEADARHEANWLLAHVLASRLLARGFRVMLDSTATSAEAVRVSYRILTLHVRGRSGMFSSVVRRTVETTVAFRLSRGDVVLWRNEYHARVRDKVPENRLDLLANSDYGFSKASVKKQTLGQFAEPVIVSGVLGGLVYMFFSNR